MRGLSNQGKQRKIGAGLSHGWSIGLRYTLAWVSAGLMLGCAIIYPEVQTAVRAPKPGQELDPPPPDDLYFIYFESASIPAKTPGGLDWPGGAPDPLAKLLVNGSELIRTPAQSSTRAPTWPKQTRQNYRVAPGSQIFVEVWDDNPMINKPICRSQVRDLPALREGANNEIWCDSGARVRLGVEPARAMVGLGLYYEPRGTEGVRVTRVVEYSPAARAGLQAGDRILAINGKDTRQLDGNQVRSAINEKAKTGVKLDVWYQSGKRHIVEIKEGPLYPLPSDEIPLKVAQGERSNQASPD
jgi:hypothetical protein